MAFIQLSDVAEKEIVPGFKAQMIHTEHMTCSFWTVKAGASLPQHSHPHEQITNMLEGEFELTVGGEAKVLRPGLLAVIPSGVPHFGKAVTDCRILDVFYPVREDYRNPKKDR